MDEHLCGARGPIFFYATSLNLSGVIRLRKTQIGSCDPANQGFRGTKNSRQCSLKGKWCELIGADMCPTLGASQKAPHAHFPLFLSTSALHVPP